MSKYEEERFNNTGKCVFGEIISDCKKFPSKIGSLDLSFMVLLCRMQINSEK